MRKLPTLLLAVASCAIAQAQVPDHWINAIEKVESNCRNVIGDKGLARGYFQFHKGTWGFVSSLRKRAGLKTYPYKYASNKIVSREYATSYLNYLNAELTERIGRKPFISELWLSYNMGLEGFARINYQTCEAPERKYRTAIKLILLIIR
jgi:hypothetical protein